MRNAYYSPAGIRPGIARPGRKCESSRLEGVIPISVPIRFDCRLLCRGRITNWVPYPMWPNRSPRPSRIGSRKSMPKTPEIDYFCPCRRGKISPTAWWNVHPPVGEGEGYHQRALQTLLNAVQQARTGHTHTHTHTYKHKALTR